MSGWLPGLLISLLLAYSSSSLAVPYDDFEGSDVLDFRRWNNNLRFVREISNGVMRSELARAESAGNNGASFVDPQTINSIQVTVNVSQAAVNAATARARVAGFFCDSNNTGDDDLTGEIYAETVIIRLKDGRLAFRYLVAQCRDPDCLPEQTVALLNNIFGTPQLNTDYQLSLAFNPATTTFTFAVDGVNRMTFGPAEAVELQNCSTSNNVSKFITTRIAEFNNDPAVPDEGGQIKATFDDVVVNGALYDDFNDRDTFDPAKWLTADQGDEFVGVEPFGAGRALRSATELCGDADSAEFTGPGFANPETLFAIATDLVVESTQVTAAPGDDNAQTSTRVQGEFYNDGTPGGGDAGNVFVRVFLADFASGQPSRQAGCLARRCNDAECNSTDTLFRHIFGEWNPGGQHRAFIGLDTTNRELVCGYDQQTFTHPISTTINAPVNPFHWLETAIFGLDQGSCASVAARFDNVTVNEFPAPPSPTTPTLRNISYGGLVPSAGMAAGFIVEQRATLVLSAERFLDQPPAMPDPTLSLKTLAGTELRANDDCDVAGIAALVGRPLTSAQDACIVQELDPGSYFIEVSDASGASGSALVAATAPLAGPAALRNISYGGPVESEGVATGFVVEQRATYAITAEGFANAPPPLADPMVVLKTLAGLELRANDDCDVADISAHIGRALGSARDACIVIELAPGDYFVEVQDAGMASGGALIGVTQSVRP